MSPATKPRWLDAYLTGTGLPDIRLAGTTAKPMHCHGCGLVVLAGYDSPLGAVLAIADPHPLTPQLEAAAVILGRPTWHLWGHPGCYELTARTPVWTKSIPLRTGTNVLVVASHRCGTPPLTRDTLPTRSTTWAVNSDGPPPF